MTAEPTSLYRCHPQDLYDFMGWLTIRKERLVLSATDNAASAAEAVAEYLTLHPEIEQGVPVSPSETRDAARYRWLRAHANDGNRWRTIDQPERFDDYVDAAIEREGK